MKMLWLIPIVPGLIVSYAMFLRPVLHKIASLNKFYTEADGFWGKAWALCDKSVTMLWGYILGGIGTALALLDPIASTLGDPNFNTQVTTFLQGNPKYLGYFTIAVSIITLAARLRTLAKV